MTTTIETLYGVFQVDDAFNRANYNVCAGFEGNLVDGVLVTFKASIDRDGNVADLDLFNYSFRKSANGSSGAKGRPIEDETIIGKVTAALSEVGQTLVFAQTQPVRQVTETVITPSKVRVRDVVDFLTTNSSADTTKVRVEGPQIVVTEAGPNTHAAAFYAGLLARAGIGASVYSRSAYQVDDFELPCAILTAQELVAN